MSNETTRSSKFQLSPVEEHLFRANNIHCDTQEALEQGIAERFTPDFFMRDESIIGQEFVSNMELQLFPDRKEQIFIPSEYEWKQGLIQFAVRTVGILDGVNKEYPKDPAGVMGHGITILLRMTKPDVQVGVRVNEGITSEGPVLGRVAERTKLLLDYTEALAKQGEIFPNLDNI